MVSRYAVDLPVIAGLIIGAQGVLYLSYGILGKGGEANLLAASPGAF